MFLIFHFLHSIAYFHVLLFAIASSRAFFEFSAAIFPASAQRMFKSNSSLISFQFGSAFLAGSASIAFLIASLIFLYSDFNVSVIFSI